MCTPRSHVNIRSSVRRGNAACGKPVDELMQRFETLEYDPWRKTGMAGADDVAGVHSSIGGVFERDHGDAHCDSRARSDNAESGGEKRFRSEPDAAIARAGIASGRPDLQRSADQCGGEADADFGLGDESV